MFFLLICLWPAQAVLEDDLLWTADFPKLLVDLFFAEGLLVFAASQIQGHA